MFQLDANDPTPLYAQLEREIRLAIATGRLRAWDQLPTVRQLAVELRVNANTVAKVYAELERAGIVETRRGVGTFVKQLATDGLAKHERMRKMSALADRFFTESAALGFSATEAIEYLKNRHPQGSSSNG